MMCCALETKRVREECCRLVKMSTCLHAFFLHGEKRHLCSCNRHADPLSIVLVLLDDPIKSSLQHVLHMTFPQTISLFLLPQSSCYGFVEMTWLEHCYCKSACKLWTSPKSSVGTASASHGIASCLFRSATNRSVRSLGERSNGARFLFFSSVRLGFGLARLGLAWLGSPLRSFCFLRCGWLWFGLARFGLAWLGLARLRARLFFFVAARLWFGSARFGLAWLGLARLRARFFFFLRCGSALFWLGSVWLACALVFFSSVRLGFGLARLCARFFCFFGAARLWFGSARFGLAWLGLARLCARFFLSSVRLGFGLARFGLARLGSPLRSVFFSSVRLGFGLARFGLALLGLARLRARFFFLRCG